MKTPVVYGVGLAVCSIVLLAPPARAPASEIETRRYLEVIERICTTGVTPEANKAHEQLVAALAKEGKVIDVFVFDQYGRRFTRKQAYRTVAGNPHGSTANFWGPRHPEVAYGDCVHTP